MNFVYIYRKKSLVFDVIKKFLKMIKTYYNFSIRFIRTNKEKTLKDKYIKLTYKYDIIIKYFITNISK